MHQYTLVGDDLFAQGAEFANAGTALLPGGDRAGARFAGFFGLLSSDVTVPQGAFYAAYRSQKQPVLNWTVVTVSGNFNSNISMGVESVYVGQAVGSGPLPTLSVALTGKGKVTSARRTINCGTVPSCTVTMNADTKVQATFSK